MPICEPYIHVECDKCGEVSDGMDLTMLAGGGWDARNIKRRLERNGWRVTGGKAHGEETICPECVAIEAEKAAATQT